MPNANQSTSPPKGGNVEDVCATTTQTNLHGVTEESVALTPNNSHTNVSEDLTNTCSTEDTTHKQHRNRVSKELGITSTSFIGPACRPEPPTIEQELCEFYKELEEVDHSDKVDGKATDEQGLNQSCNTEPAQKKDSPVDVTDHSRSYPDPHKRREQQWQHEDAKRWRPHTQCVMEAFGKRQHLDPRYHPPPWIPQGPPNSDFPNFPPPPSGGPIYPLDIRPHQNFYSHVSNWAPWEGSRLPANEWHGNKRGLPSYGYSEYSEEYETNSSIWHNNNPEQQYDYKEDQYHHHHHYSNTLCLILLRGLPGSGKSTLARELMSSRPNGTILSTDDYFFQNNTYVFDGTRLAEAHDWNQKRTEHAMSEGRSPVIIDNTNMKAWEMKPYVKMALDNGYKVDFREPETNWKYDSTQLEKRNKHGVPRETIEKMLDRFEWPVNIDIVMNSVTPPHKSRGH